MTINISLFIALLIGINVVSGNVVGNYAVIASPLTHVHTDNKPLIVATPDLWCGLEVAGLSVPVEYGQFTRWNDKKVIEGTIKSGKVYLKLGKVPAQVAGQYKCEVRGTDGEIYSGISNVYLPPVLHLESSDEYTENSSHRPPIVTREKIIVQPKTKITLKCPIISNPPSMIRWQIDKKPIDTSDDISHDGDNLILSDPLSGEYTCIADNSFPLFVGGPAIPHELIYNIPVSVE